MRSTRLSVGYVPLIDCAPLIVAAEMGFAAEEGIALDLRRAPCWSAARDMLSFGQVEAAHMLSPVPVAVALGLGGGGVSLDAVAVLSVDGQVVGVLPGRDDPLPQSLFLRSAIRTRVLIMPARCAVARRTSAYAPSTLLMGAFQLPVVEALIQIVDIGRQRCPPDRI